MSHLLEVLVLMITISILPFSCINTIWRGQSIMQRSNNGKGMSDKYRGQERPIIRNIIKSDFNTLLTNYGEFFVPLYDA